MSLRKKNMYLWNGKNCNNFTQVVWVSSLNLSEETFRKYYYEGFRSDEEVLDKKAVFVFEGKRYLKLTEALDDIPVSYDTLLRWKKAGYTTWKLVNTSRGKPITFEGKTYTSVKAASEQIEGLTYKQLKIIRILGLTTWDEVRDNWNRITQVYTKTNLD